MLPTPDFIWRVLALESEHRTIQDIGIPICSCLAHSITVLNFTTYFGSGAPNVSGASPQEQKLSASCIFVKDRLVGLCIMFSYVTDWPNFRRKNSSLHSS